jgi:hypothetical protein
MKLAFILTSAIEVDPNKSLGVELERPRSVHSTEERMRQTFLAIGSIYATYPNADVFLLDASKNFRFPKEKVKSWSTLKCFYPAEYNPQLQNVITSHPNKSYCEAIMLLDFINNNKEILSQYDLIFKGTGRYVTYFKNEVELDSSKIYFKKPLVFNWDDAWNYHLVDLRSQTQDNTFRQYPSVIFGFGKDHFYKFVDILEILINLTSKPEYSHYDIETLLYYCTRPFEKDIIETNWIISGFVGSTNEFYWY